jgi:hypothetical protein
MTAKQWLNSAGYKSLAFWKRLLSVRKTTWELGDYPVLVRAQDNPYLEDAGPRLKHPRYWASIVNWWVVGDGGETPEEAVRNLAKRFEETRNRMLREGKTMPRPGTHVAIEFSPQEKVEIHSELRDDFVRRVLKLDWAWISDESSLWDFHTNETNQSYVRTISLLYGVDVSDIESGNIAEILERIALARRAQTHGS